MYHFYRLAGFCLPSLILHCSPYQENGRFGLTVRWYNRVLIFDIDPDHSSIPPPLASIYRLAKPGKTPTRWFCESFTNKPVVAVQNEPWYNRHPTERFPNSYLWRGQKRPPLYEHCSWRFGSPESKNIRQQLKQNRPSTPRYSSYCKMMEYSKF